MYLYHPPHLSTSSIHHTHPSIYPSHPSINSSIDWMSYHATIWLHLYTSLFPLFTSSIDHLFYSMYIDQARKERMALIKNITSTNRIWSIDASSQHSWVINDNESLNAGGYSSDEDDKKAKRPSTKAAKNPDNEEEEDEDEQEEEEENMLEALGEGVHSNHRCRCMDAVIKMIWWVRWYDDMMIWWWLLCLSLFHLQDASTSLMDAWIDRWVHSSYDFYFLCVYDSLLWCDTIWYRIQRILYHKGTTNYLLCMVAQLDAHSAITCLLFMEGLSAMIVTFAIDHHTFIGQVASW